MPIKPFKDGKNYFGLFEGHSEYVIVDHGFKVAYKTSDRMVISIPYVGRAL